MIRRKDELRRSITLNAKGGQGEFINDHLLEKEEFYGAGRLYAKCTLAPGHSVGLHTHTGEIEICYFLSGHGVIETDGKKVEIGPGDVNIVFDGENHAVINDSVEPLIYTALILMMR